MLASSNAGIFHKESYSTYTWTIGDLLIMGYNYPIKWPCSHHWTIFKVLREDSPLYNEQEMLLGQMEIHFLCYWMGTIAIKEWLRSILELMSYNWRFYINFSKRIAKFKKLLKDVQKDNGIALIGRVSESLRESEADDDWWTLIVLAKSH